MQLFIGNIPAGTGVGELSRLFTQDLEKSVWRRLKLGGLKRFSLDRDARFNVVQKRLKDQVFRYGLVEIDDADVARSFINSLNGAVLRGNRLKVREFVHRAYGNERRAVSSHGGAYTGKDRRGGERRGAKEFLWEVAQSRSGPTPVRENEKSVDKAPAKHLFF